MIKQYVGARYVPKFASPVAWSSGTSYEAMTIVTYNNSSYTSKIPVPATVGNPADNPDYWALTGNYNAQVEQYRQTVEKYKSDTDATLAQNSAEIVKLNADIISKANVYDSVADMQAATNIRAGAICHTLGFHAPGDNGAAWYKVSTTGTANGMDAISLYGGLMANLQVTGPYVTPEMFGAQKDSASFDNTPYFIRCFDFLRNAGGRIQLGNGNYNFNTPLVVDNYLYGITFEGTAPHASNDNPAGKGGTLLTYNGTGNFMTFNSKVHNCCFQNFAIELGDSAYGMQFNLTAHKSSLININVTGGKGMLDFNTGTYTKIEHCGYSTGVSNAEYGIRIGASENHYTSEFFYVFNTSIDFQNASSANNLAIYRMPGGFWMHDCDFCNTHGSAVLIDNQFDETMNYFDFDNNNISGCGIGYDLRCTTGNIGGVFINNQRIAVTFDNINNRFIKTSGASNKSIELHFKNSYLRSRPGNVPPTYLCEFARTTFNCEIELTSGESFDIPSYFENPVGYYKDYRIEYNWQFNGINSTGDKKFPLSSVKTIADLPSGIYVNGFTNANVDIYFISVTVENGIPYANLRVAQVPNGRVQVHIDPHFLSRSSAID